MINYFQIGFHGNLNTLHPIGSVKATQAEFVGAKDGIPPLYILSWDNTATVEIKDATDNQLKNAQVNLSDITDKHYRVEVLTANPDGSPDTWRFVAKDRGAELQKFKDRIEAGYDSNPQLQIDFATFDLYAADAGFDFVNFWTPDLK